MTTHVERSIEVNVPVRTVYDQWTQFEDFPRFMGGVQQVLQVGDTLTHWVAEIAGVRREWDAAILEQVPDQKVAWAATSGATNAGTVYFDAVGENRTRVRLTLDYEPEGILEKIGDVLDVVERQAVADLDRFKQFIESRGAATGGWRGAVDDAGAPAVGADAAAAGGTAAADVARAGVQGESGAAGAGRADATDAGVPGGSGSTEATGRTGGADVPGDIVAVGPTGGTRSTLETEPGPARSTAPVADDSALGHSGDPVAVDPAAVSDTATQSDAERTGSAAGAAAAGTGVAGFGTDTGMSSSPTSGVLTGDPGAHSAGNTATQSGDSERTGAAAGAASSSPAGVTGFGTDTGMSSSPTSGVLTGDPGARSANRNGPGEAGTGRSDWTDEPGARGGVTEAATDPVGEAWADDPGTRSATSGTGEAWAAAGSGPGEDRAATGTRGEGVVQRNFADEDISTRDVVARDFDDRDVTGGGTVERDFANRNITERDIANRGIVTDRGDAPATPTPQPTSLDAADAPGPTDGVGAALDPLDPRAGTADDPDNPTRPSV